MFICTDMIMHIIMQEMGYYSPMIQIQLMLYKNYKFCHSISNRVASLFVWLKTLQLLIPQIQRVSDLLLLVSFQEREGDRYYEVVGGGFDEWNMGVVFNVYRKGGGEIGERIVLLRRGKGVAER